MNTSFNSCRNLQIHLISSKEKKNAMAMCKLVELPVCRRHLAVFELSLSQQNDVNLLARTLLLMTMNSTYLLIKCKSNNLEYNDGEKFAQVIKFTIMIKVSTFLSIMLTRLPTRSLHASVFLSGVLVQCNTNKHNVEYSSISRMLCRLHCCNQNRILLLQLCWHRRLCTVVTQ